MDIYAIAHELNELTERDSLFRRIAEGELGYEDGLAIGNPDDVQIRHIGPMAAFKSLDNVVMPHNKALVWTHTTLRFVCAAQLRCYRAERSSASLAGWKSPSGKG